MGLLCASGSRPRGLHGTPGPPDPSTIAKYAKKPGYSPYAGLTYPSHVYWGDQHVHTAWSADAGMSGATLTPA